MKLIQKYLQNDGCIYVEGCSNGHTFFFRVYGDGRLSSLGMESNTPFGSATLSQSDRLNVWAVREADALAAEIAAKDPEFEFEA